MVVEDSADSQRLLSFILKHAGADVTLADNGLLGVELALSAREAGRPFGIVLMDMQMPVMDGYTATAKLREAGYHGQIVALTAHAMVGESAKCLAAGCDHFVSKPIQQVPFLAQIACWMGQPSCIKPAAVPR